MFRNKIKDFNGALNEGDTAGGSTKILRDWNPILWLLRVRSYIYIEKKKYFEGMVLLYCCEYI